LRGVGECGIKLKIKDEVDILDISIVDDLNYYVNKLEDINT